MELDTPAPWSATIVGFRPLDGESFSKHPGTEEITQNVPCFRPLDGESFSKQFVDIPVDITSVFGFRPLDGESFSKRQNQLPLQQRRIYRFPSPRRGIIF